MKKRLKKCQPGWTSAHWLHLGQWVVLEESRTAACVAQLLALERQGPTVIEGWFRDLAGRIRKRNVYLDERIKPIIGGDCIRRCGVFLNDIDLAIIRGERDPDEEMRKVLEGERRNKT